MRKPTKKELAAMPVARVMINNVTLKRPVRKKWYQLPFGAVVETAPSENGKRLRAEWHRADDTGRAVVFHRVLGWDHPYRYPRKFKRLG